MPKTSVTSFGPKQENICCMYSLGPKLHDVNLHGVVGNKERFSDKDFSTLLIA